MNEYQWKTVSIVGFDELMQALDRADRKGYMSDAIKEDCDASLFFNAYKDKYGVDPKYTYKHTNNRSPIRNYDSYNRNKAVDFALVALSSGTI